MEFTATMGTHLPITNEALVDQVLADLDSAHVAVHTVPEDRDHLAVTITFPAATVADAVTVALLMAQAANLGEIVTIDVAPTALVDVRNEILGDQTGATVRVSLPELVGVTQAAEALKVSRATIRRRVGKDLVGQVVDGITVVTKASLDAALMRQADRS